MRGSELSHGRYAALLAACVASAGALFFAVSLCFEPFDGDLTRIGEYPESRYGRRLPQERFARGLAVSSGAYDRYHDVVVVGDSFSLEPAGGAWTDFFVQATGASVLVLPRDLTPRELVETPRFRDEPPRLVVYASVERLLKGRLSAVPPVAAGTALPEPRPRPLLAAARPEPSVLVARRLRKRFGEGSLRHVKDRVQAELLRRLGRPSGEVRELRLRRPLFSSPRPDALLVYSAEGQGRAWSAAELDAVRGALRSFRALSESGGKTLFLTLVIPDKLGAYAEELADPAERARALSPLRLGGELHPVEAGAPLAALIRAGTLDVYLPADTHLGSAGARAVADAVIAELRRRGALVFRGGGS